MNIYAICDKQNFLFNVADYINKLSIKKNDLIFADHCHVILPNINLRNLLYQIFIDKYKLFAMPQISTIDSLSINSKSVFCLEGYMLNKASFLEEKLVLSDLINQYPEFNHDNINNIHLAGALSDLFYIFDMNNLSICDMANITGSELASHWQKTYEFLQYAYEKFHLILRSNNYVSNAIYQKNILNALKLQLCKMNTSSDIKQENLQHVIFVGSIFKYISHFDFIADIKHLDNVHMLLSRIPNGLANKSLYESEPQDAMWYYSLLFKALDIKINDFDFHKKNTSNVLLKNNINLYYAGCDLGDKSNYTILDTLITNKDEKSLSNSKKNKIRYVEFENIFHESEYIAKYCADLCTENKNIKIALALNYQSINKYYINALKKYDLKFSNLLGSNLLEHKYILYIKDIAQFICNKFSIKNFTALILNSVIRNDVTQNIYNDILTHNRYAESLDELRQTLYGLYDISEHDISINNESDNLIINHFNSIYEVIKDSKKLLYKADNNNFIEILEIILDVAEKLNCKIGHQKQFYDGMSNISDVLNKIYNSKFPIHIDNISQFNDALNALICNISIYDNGEDKITEEQLNKIVIGDLAQISLIDFDILIITNFNEGHYPSNIEHNPWINKTISNKLNLHVTDTQIGINLYNFYLSLHNNKVLITRSKKYSSSQSLLPSPFLLRLQNILKGVLHKEYCVADQYETDYQKYINTDLNHKYVKAKYFPSRISATDIELLMRSPYNFYAKKILKLRAQNKIRDVVEFSDFGNFFHKVVEVYTDQFNEKSNSSRYEDCLELFNQISYDILQKYSVFENDKNKWHIRIKAIAKDFVQYDIKRRLNYKKIYSEIKGRLKINVAGQNILIESIADRIDLDENGNFVIIDYKTGTVPVAGDIKLGLSPQLIIEALTILDGIFFKEYDNFTEIINSGTITNSISLIYIKINNNFPYITEHKVNIKDKDLEDHMIGLKKLLEHYVVNKEFHIKANISRYDDYEHLARRDNKASCES